MRFCILRDNILMRLTLCGILHTTLFIISHYVIVHYFR